jgi:GST-like protein
MAEQLVVFGEADTGSVAVEATLTLLGVAYRLEEVRSGAPDAGFSPMAQVPALRLPGGELMTESAAILTWLADSHPGSGLSPALDSPDRPAFLRWMAFVSAAIYALYWVRDVPSRLVDDEACQAQVKTRLRDRILHCWSVMEAGLDPGRYLLGESLTVLDIYVTVVSRWAPRAALHEVAAPRIGEVVRRVESDPRLAALWAERFPLRGA